MGVCHEPPQRLAGRVGRAASGLFLVTHTEHSFVRPACHDMRLVRLEPSAVQSSVSMRLVLLVVRIVLRTPHGQQRSGRLPRLDAADECGERGQC
jgi:hypothetical protein